VLTPVNNSYFVLPVNQELIAENKRVNEPFAQDYNVDMCLRFTFRTIASATLVGVFLLFSALSLLSNEHAYIPRSEEEVEVLSFVIASEIKAHNWTKNELICFSVDWLDPAPELVRSLRQRHLNLRSSAEWPKKFNCGFELQLEYSQFDLSRTMKVHSKVVDLREINKGEGDLALLERDGEYSLQKVNGKWLIREYAAKPLTLPSPAIHCPDPIWPRSATIANYPPNATPSFDSPEGVTSYLEKRWSLTDVKRFATPERRHNDAYQNLVIDTPRAWAGRLYCDQQTGFDSIEWYATVANGHVKEYSLEAYRGRDFWVLEIGDPTSAKVPPIVEPDPTAPYFVGHK
jgi:hypothetical protein